MLIEVRVQSLWVDGTTNTPVVMLKELSGERVLPIWIGPGEASAIATELAAMEFARPLTHDLLCTVMKQLGGSLQRVIISRVEDSTYYAELSVLKNGEIISLDAKDDDLKRKLDIKTVSPYFYGHKTWLMAFLENAFLELSHEPQSSFSKIGHFFTFPDLE